MLAVQSACICICGRAALSPERVRLAGKNESAPVTVAVLEDSAGSWHSHRSWPQLMEYLLNIIDIQRLNIWTLIFSLLRLYRYKGFMD